MVFAVATTSCSNNKNEVPDPVNPEASSKFIIAGAAATAEQSKTYLFTSDALDQGSITVKGNGYETDGSTLKIQNNKAFSFKYNRGNDGFTEVFKLNNSNALEKVSSFSVKSVNVFLPYQNSKYLLAYNIGRSLTTSGTAYWINTESSSVDRNAAFDQKIIYVDGKKNENYYAFIYSFFEVKDKIYAVYAPTYGGKDDVGKVEFDYKNRAFVSIFDKDMKFIKTINDTRMPYIGRYYTSTGLGQATNGDVYVFSNGETTSSNQHSAFLKIVNDSYDANYYWDVEQVAGKKIEYGKYLGNNKFILLLADRDDAKAESEGGKLAIVDPVKKEFNWVSGVSQKINLQGYDYPLFIHDGKAYLALSEKTSLSVIYEINPANNSAKRGLELQGVSEVTGLGVLSK